MKLRELIKGYEVQKLRGDLDVEVSGITDDSRSVKPGYLFFALKGERVDGRDFIPQAIEAGAVGVVAEGGVNSPDAPYIGVNDVHDAMAFVADRFYGHPSQGLKLVGITGTNGKTTTAYLVYQMLETLGKKVGLTGTIRYIIGSKTQSAPLTTPTSIEFQRILSEMLRESVEIVVSEVSSHALHQKRVSYTDFDIGVFTNLSHDHLDYHGDMESYFRAKEGLFRDFKLKKAVINVDDPYGERLIKSLKIRGKELISYGLKHDATLRAKEVVTDIHGASLLLEFENRIYRVRTPLPGITNVYNLLAALGTTVALGFGIEDVIETLTRLKPAEGRMELIKEGQPFTVVVDYAHTPDALEKLLETVRGFTSNRIITVFGCGGNRDKKKRPEMGEIAERLSDMVVVTSDNPRYEEEEQIIRDILSGMKMKKHIVLKDRKEAIHRALQLCELGDVLVIAGKGHEDYQEIRGMRMHFDDREVVREWIKSQAVGNRQ